MNAETIPGGLSIAARVMLLRAGLLTEAQVQDLISDAMAQNVVHYLPLELREYAARQFKAGKIQIPES